MVESVLELSNSYQARMSSRTNPTATSAAYNAKELPSEAHLDAMEEELNQRVDMEVESMRTGMMDLVKLSNVRCRFVSLPTSPVSPRH